MTLIYKPGTNSEEKFNAKLTVLVVNANHEGEVSPFFQRLYDSLKDETSEYAPDNGAYHIVHASNDIQMTMEEKTFPEKSLDSALRRFAQAMADHCVVFELHYPDGFKCRLQFV